MNALKNLIKLLYWSVALLLAQPLNAQILGMGINFEKLNLPEPFLQNLENCTAYQFSQTAVSDDIEVKTTYRIAPTQNSLCHLHIDGQTNVSVNILQDCKLTLSQAQTYADALRNYQKKSYSPRLDGAKIEKDPDYLRALKIMSDRHVCRFVRQKIDHTDKIRQNLEKCAPATQEETSASLKVERQIIGSEDDNCHYTFKITQLSKEDASNLREKLKFSCAFNAEQRARYLQILENLVIPEEEGYDFSSVQRISVVEELNFILDNCTLEPKS